MKRLLKYESEIIDHDNNINPNLTFQKLSNDRNKNSNVNINNQNINNNGSSNNLKSHEMKKISLEKIKKGFGAASKNRTASTDVSKRMKLTKKDEGKDKLNNSMMTVPAKKKSSIMKVDSKSNNLDIATSGKANISMDASLAEKKTKPFEKSTIPANKNGNLSTYKAGQDNEKGGLFNNLLGDGYLEYLKFFMIIGSKTWLNGKKSCLR